MDAAKTLAFAVKKDYKIDSIKIVQPRVRIETPLGAIEADTGNPIMDGAIVVAIILLLYIGKKLVDKFIRNK